MKVLVVQNDPVVPIGALGPPLLECDIQLDVWATWRDEPPRSVDQWGGIVVLGGAANPDQDDEFCWLEPERQVLGQAIDHEIPILGICLGAELLTQVTGGRVHRLPEPEIGWLPIHTAASAIHDPLWRAVPEQFPGFEWHSYSCVPPPEATLLATSCGGSVEAFRYHDRIWAMQFHLEVDQQTIHRWIIKHQDHLRELGKDPAILVSESADLVDASRRRAGAVGRRFAGVVERTALS